MVRFPITIVVCVCKVRMGVVAAVPTQMSRDSSVCYGLEPEILVLCVPIPGFL